MMNSRIINQWLCSLFVTSIFFKIWFSDQKGKNSENRTERGEIDHERNTVHPSSSIQSASKASQLILRWRNLQFQEVNQKFGSRERAKFDVKQFKVNRRLKIVWIFEQIFSIKLEKWFELLTIGIMIWNQVLVELNHLHDANERNLADNCTYQIR